jgi:methionine biosynthesis protein MetW
VWASIGIVSFPNFAHWPQPAERAARPHAGDQGLPYQWYDTPNIRVGTFADFEVLAEQNGPAHPRGLSACTRAESSRHWPNLMASTAVFKFERR